MTRRMILRFLVFILPASIVAPLLARSTKSATFYRKLPSGRYEEVKKVNLVRHPDGTVEILDAD
ncbi:MAG: hypothetical protein ACE5KS_02960 [Woeseiaceae bacterium]